MYSCKLVIWNSSFEHLNGNKVCGKETIKKTANLAITWSNVFNNRMFLPLPRSLSHSAFSRVSLFIVRMDLFAFVLFELQFYSLMKKNIYLRPFFGHATQKCVYFVSVINFTLYALILQLLNVQPPGDTRSAHIQELINCIFAPLLKTELISTIFFFTDFMGAQHWDSLAKKHNRNNPNTID